MIENIVLGDTFELLPQLKDKSIPVILTDPPYTYSQEEKEFLHSQFLRICKGVIIVFSPWKNPWIFPSDQKLYWIKPISTKNTSKNYSNFVEEIFIYGRHVWNSKRHWSQYPNVMTDLVEEKDHPWRKPLSLIQRLILNHSNPGDIIFDPFMGSGTMPLAALLTNRKCLGFENDKSYFDITNERIYKMKQCLQGIL